MLNYIYNLYDYYKTIGNRFVEQEFIDHYMIFSG
jgi:hypothetical protein